MRKYNRSRADNTLGQLHAHLRHLQKFVGEYASLPRRFSFIELRASLLVQYIEYMGRGDNSLGQKFVGEFPVLVLNIVF